MEYLAAEVHSRVPVTTFSTKVVVDLEITVALHPGVGGLPQTFSGPHQLDVRVQTPGGRLYQVLTVPFTTDDVGAGATRQVAGYPRPLKVQRVALAPIRRSNTKMARVTVRLPVGGTAISSSGLYGGWGVEVLVDGVQFDCVTGRKFTLTP